MVKRLARHGNSLALIIDRPVLDLLRIDEKTPLSITTDGRCLVVSPAGDDRRRKTFGDALARTSRRHAGAFRRLAE